MKNEHSTWKTEVQAAAYPKLDHSDSADVAIIGGGLVGVLSAYFLGKAGKKVVLLEKETLGSNASGLTTAFITNYLDTDASDLVRMYGEEKTKKIYASHRTAIETIVKIAEEEEISCELERCSNYIFAHEPDAYEDLENEHDTLTKLGIESTLSDKNSLGFENYGHIEIPDQAKFHPMKFIAGVADKAALAGVEIYEHSEVVRIHHKGNYLIETVDGIHIEAKHVISATYEPFAQPASLFLKKGMYVTYVYEGEIPSGAILSGIYEDTMIPYHYFRVDKGDMRDRIIFGGEDHRQDIPVDPEKNFAALEEFARKILRDTPLTITRRWSGPILEPVDGLASIGKHEKDGILYAFGFSGTGMTYSAIAAAMFYDAIMEEPNDWVEIYHPDRIPGPKTLAIKGRDYIQEFMRGAVKNSFRSRTRR